MRLIIEKSTRKLRLMQGGETVFSCRIGLGREPVGAKEAEGDGRTPEGTYFICLVKEEGKYGRSLGLSYPGPEDAHIRLAHQEHRRPPWGSPMGGEVYIHEGGSDRDWTQGCIALDEADMDQLFPHWEEIEWVEIQA